MSIKRKISKSRMLIVDDEEDNLLLLARIFAESCVISIAENGKQALDLIQDTDFDIILLDIMMPVLDGLSLLRTIRRMYDITELPVVLISAMSEHEDIANGIRQGANDYIVKPFDPDGVRARVTTQIMMKQLADERHQHIQQLQKMNKVQARMMQVASHDLKNPLNNLKMLTKIMRDDATDPEKIVDYVDILENSVKTMLGLIEDFFDHPVASSTELTIQLQTEDSQQMVDEVIKQYGLAARKKDITIVTKGAMGCRVLADAKRLQQVLGNLLSNAIKYSPHGSTVTLCGEIDADCWRLRVKDEGPGIPTAEHSHLFQPFSNGKISTQPTDGESSTGLGLSIVKQMIELQDGSVGVEFPKEGGSVFWLELTLSPQCADV